MTNRQLRPETEYLRFRALTDGRTGLSWLFAGDAIFPRKPKTAGPGVRPFPRFGPALWVGSGQGGDELWSARTAKASRHIPTRKCRHARNRESGQLVVVKGDNPVRAQDDVAEDVAECSRVEGRRGGPSVTDSVQAGVQPANRAFPGFHAGLVGQCDQASDLWRGRAGATDRKPAHPVRVRERGDPHKDATVHCRVPGHIRHAAGILADDAGLDTLPRGRWVDHARAAA